ncbi:MAG TPA: isoprenylcysteine carboxylmethyltransferase family protein [Polyangiaceae bacterium]|nr:isoprenylcysteine carboxylmethyltransferase family protein [Polyangiaceae bacterium]
MLQPLLLTTFLLTWAIGWGKLHTRIRKDRAYADGRTTTSSDATYRWANPLLFAMQVSLCTASFWTSSPWLLAVHHSAAVRVAGVALFCVGTALYAWALAHLGANYSPCYDTHAPLQLVRSGPYRAIRHPMYAGKLIVGVATLVLSGSLWFVPTTVYLFVATLRAMFREDSALGESLPEYRHYQGQTTMLVPWVI